MSLSDALQKLKEIDPNDIDFENMGGWPLPIRIAACVLTMIAVLIFGYQFYLTGIQDNYSKAVTVEQDLKEQFRIKAFQAANLDAYRGQMEKMKVSFGALIRQLPTDTEVPGLLEDITFTGRGVGLLIEGIKLQPERVTEFYIELPISVSVKGTYHDLGNFVSGVASLSRIVTLHDFEIEPGEGDQLKMKILAKTYRYNDREAN